MKRMEQAGRRHQRNTFRTAVFFIVLLITIVSIALYLFFYFSFSDFARKEAINTNRSVTDSLSYTISEMDSSIRNFCVSQYFASDVQYLMHVDDPDTMTIQQTITRLKHSAASNLSIQSIGAYNDRTGILYSTIRGISDIDEDIKRIIFNAEYAQLKPIPRVISEGDYYSAQPVFSYFLCDTGISSNVDCAMIVNLNADWLGSKLKNLCTGDEERLIIFDDEFHILADSHAAVKDFNTLAPTYCADILKNAETQIKTIGGEKYYIAASPISDTDWYLLREVPYRRMLQEFYSLEWTLLVFSVTVLALAVLLSFIIVRRIYAPIREVANFLQEKTQIEAGSKRYDELAYISQTIRTVEESYQLLRKNSHQILQENTLRSLLAGYDPSVKDSPESANIVYEMKSLLQHSMILLLCGDFSALLQSVPSDQQPTVAYDLDQMLQQALPVCDPAGIITTAADERTVLISAETEPDQLRAAFSALNTQLKQQYGLSIVGITEYDHAAVEQLSPHRRFLRLEKTAKYRIFFEPGCLLDSSILTEKDALPLNYPAEQVQNMIGALKRKDLALCENLYRQFSETVCESNNFENYQFCIMQLFLSMRTLKDELSNYVTNQLQLDMDGVYSELLNAEFSTQIDAVFLSLIRQLCDADSDVNSKHSVLLESVQDYIDLHYADKELTLKQIAADFNISHSYLGRLFREYFGQSVKEYITSVRLDVAADHLAKSSMSIKRIMDISGFDNESNFFRLFRTRFGITPNNYRMHSSISKLQSPGDEK